MTISPYLTLPLRTEADVRKLRLARAYAILGDTCALNAAALAFVRACCRIKIQ